MTATAFKVFTIIIMVVVLFMHFSSYFFLTLNFFFYLNLFYTQIIHYFPPTYTYSEHEFDLPFPTFLAINSLSSFG